MQVGAGPGAGHRVPLLQLRGISKRYGGVTALQDVDLDVAAGEVVGLVGDNGAGKSTLVKIVAGTERADAGEFDFDGVPRRLTSPHDAVALGIATVYQDLALCENLNVIENMFLGRELAAPPLVGPLRQLREPEMARMAGDTLSSLSIRMPSLRQPVALLSGGQRQAVAVSRAVLWGSKLVLLDEPTAALGVEQTAQVLELVKTLARRGLGVVIVSHNLVDVFAVADRICVLRLGANAGVFDRRTTAPDQIVAAITGGGTLH
jgi:D-xylose transport system ATP-binding protein